MDVETDDVIEVGGTWLSPDHSAAMELCSEHSGMQKCRNGRTMKTQAMACVVLALHSCSCHHPCGKKLLGVFLLLPRAQLNSAQAGDRGVQC